MRALVERLVVTGGGKLLTGMETFETNGDVTSMSFSDIETGFDFGAGETADVFSIEAVDQGR